MARASRPWNVMGRMPIPRHATTRPLSSSSPRLCAFALSLRLPSSLPEIRTPPRLRPYARGKPSVMGGKDPAQAGSRSAFDVARASRPWNVMGRMPMPPQATRRTFSSISLRLCASALAPSLFFPLASPYTPESEGLLGVVWPQSWGRLNTENTEQRPAASARRPIFKLGAGEVLVLL